MKYSHGGNIRKAAENYGIDESAIIDFSANINPLGLSPMAREAISAAMGTIINYPDPKSSCLVKALSQYHSLPSENILTGNGATELIFLIPRALKFKSALIIAPAFSEYERALTLSDCKVEHFFVTPEKDFMLNLSDLFAAMEKGHDSLWLGNPANPAGTLISKKDIIIIGEKSAELGITLIVDEAFIDFCEEASVKNEILNFSNLIVLRSMTKFFALAGLRAGYLFAHNRIISQLGTYKEPWTLNSLSEAAAVASLSDHDYKNETLALIERERNFLKEELGKIDSLYLYDSFANYLLIGLAEGARSEYLENKLLRKNRILVRDCSNYRGLSNRFIRVAVKGRADNRSLADAFAGLFRD